MPTIAKNQLLTSHEVGSLLQMDPSSVVKWVNDGILPAYRTPGKHRRILVSDLVAFLRQHQMYVPPSLCTRVFVVDGDEDALRALARGAKGQEDVEIVTCASAVDALVKIGAAPPDLVVVAAKLPDLDGLAMVRALKAAAGTKDVPVVIAAESVSPALEKNALAAGARALVAKPLTASGLVELLAPAAP